MIEQLTIGQLAQIAAALTGGTSQTKAQPSPARAYVVCSTTRDIFFGWATETGPQMTLHNARRVYYYAKRPEPGVGGVDSLATHGPATGSKVGPIVHHIDVMNVGNASVCTDAAIAAWEAAQWE